MVRLPGSFLFWEGIGRMKIENLQTDRQKGLTRLTLSQLNLLLFISKKQ